MNATNAFYIDLIHSPMELDWQALEGSHSSKLRTTILRLLPDFDFTNKVCKMGVLLISSTTRLLLNNLNKGLEERTMFLIIFKGCSSKWLIHDTNNIPKMKSKCMGQILPILMQVINEVHKSNKMVVYNLGNVQPSMTCERLLRNAKNAAARCSQEAESDLTKIAAES